MNEPELLGPPPLTRWQRTKINNPDILERRRKYSRARSKTPEEIERRRLYYLANKHHLNALTRAYHYRRKASMSEEELAAERKRHRDHKRKLRQTEEGRKQLREIHARWRKTKGVEYFSNPETKQRISNQVISWRRRNWERFLGHVRKRRQNPKARLIDALRARVSDFIKGKKSKKTIDYIGCTLDQLKAHLESQFLPGMSWTNFGRGKGKWQVDHIEALANVDFSDEDQVRKALHWSNLRPLWFLDNIRKGKKNGKAIGQMPLLLMEAAA
jgi:hypothetical protein